MTEQNQVISAVPMRVGLGYDVHAFAPDRKLILGGVETVSYTHLTLPTT